MDHGGSSEMRPYAEQILLLGNQRLAVTTSAPYSLACGIAYALLLELGIAFLLFEESLKRRTAILDDLLGHDLGTNRIQGNCVGA
jgi:hypothetical protein